MLVSALCYSLLSVLSEPLNVEGTTHTVNAASVRYDLEKLRRQVRNAFLDINVASRLFHHISELIEEVQDIWYSSTMTISTVGQLYKS